MLYLNKYIKNSLYAASLLGVTAACEPEIDRPAPDYEEARGNADFSVYVALGNSLTSGFASNALNREGQINSYPAIIAEQMDYITPDFAFNQPLVPEGEATGTILLNGLTPEGLPVLGRVKPENGIPLESYYAPVEGPFNNLGVPGATVGQLIAPGFGNPANGAGRYNPYYARFASSPTATVVGDAIALDPTFFTLWIGNNDVLGYATAGGVVGANGEDAITDVVTFKAAYSAIINQLVAANPEIEGALANIPAVSQIPYFQAVSWNRFALDASQAAAISAAVKAKIEPTVQAGVDSVAKTKIIRAVIEAGTRQRIEAEARQPVAEAVATQIVYNQAYTQAFEAAIAAGVSEEEAEVIATQQAEAYVASPEGQQKIAGLKNALVNDQAPEEAQVAFEAALDNQVEVVFNSEEVQDQIDAAYNAAINNMDNLEAVLGAEGAAAVEANFTSPEVEAMREAGFNSKITELQAGGFYPTFSEGPNGFVVDDLDSPTGIRQLNEDDLVTFTVSSASEEELNPAAGDITIPEYYVLDVQEQEEVSQAIEGYNQIIAEIADEHTFALVDMNAFFADVVDGGISDSGTNFTNAFITGNTFSLDGVHLTQKGYALVAKRFIDVINAYYGSEIPEPNIRNYPAVKLP